MSSKTEKNNSMTLSRRGFLGSVAGAAITLASPAVIASSKPARDWSTEGSPAGDRELSFYNTHTGEKLKATFWSGGEYLDDGRKQIDWILRDHRAGVASAIDPKLLDLLFHLQAKVEHPGEFQIISGYRSPATNKMLSKKSSGVAKRSYHMQGKAIDVRLPGFDTKQLRKAALAMKGGGVGYYARSNFVHLDVGRVRYW